MREAFGVVVGDAGLVWMFGEAVAGGQMMWRMTDVIAVAWGMATIAWRTTVVMAMLAGKATASSSNAPALRMEVDGTWTPRQGTPLGAQEQE